MAVQIPDPGIGNNQTGDNEYVFRKKVKDNFSDQTNAASRLVGAAAGQIPLAQDAFKASHIYSSEITEGVDFNTLPLGSRYLAVVNKEGDPVRNPNSPPPLSNTNSYIVVETHALNSSVSHAAFQISYNFKDGSITTRQRFTDTWGEWKSSSQNDRNYTLTTASGANVVVDTTGKLLRSTSSERYKDVLAPLVLDDARYADAMALKPIVYRSTADADNPAYHFYSFSAEELGAYDPAFTLWRETETVTDADGITTEQPLAERQAEGININALLAMGHAIAIKQGELIKDLQEQINALKPKLEV